LSTKIQNWNGIRRLKIANCLGIGPYRVASREPPGIRETTRAA
jgi:hypothetical protein